MTPAVVARTIGLRSALGRLPMMGQRRRGGIGPMVALLTTFVLAGGGLIAGCAADPEPTTPPSARPTAGSPTSTETPVVAHGTPEGSPSSSGPSAQPTNSEPPGPPTALAVSSPGTLPVSGSAAGIVDRILMAPGPGGTLSVSIPRPDGSILALLDPSGKPLPGWPIVVAHSTACGFLAAVGDGSVRVVCDATDLARHGLDADDVRALAFDATGRVMAGWPVTLRPGGTGRMIGDVLTVLEAQALTDVIGPDPQQPTVEVWTATIAASGTVRTGTHVIRVQADCAEQWAIGPDGVAYGAARDIGQCTGTSPTSPDVASRLSSLDQAGVRPGWPVTFDGIASDPAFGREGRIVTTVASVARRTSRVLAFDRAGKAASFSSVVLPIATADSGVDCVVSSPDAPLVAADGTVFVTSEMDRRIYALDASLDVKVGWPYEPPTARAPLERPGDCVPGGLCCAPPHALPAVGSGRILYVPLQARDATVGGSIVAVGPDGQVRPGWPVELKRPGAMFWSVVVGPDGTTYALAMEPEAGGATSATIMAIDPNGRVRYRTTIVEP